ncbi:MAG: NUDIX domain-containing protein [Candidatus Sericytochromatia bacterium]|nr:NUDIX domain-containing protein [Candidatus Tanganyikabacteria bacterium]
MDYTVWLDAYRPWDELEAAHLAVHRECWATRRIGPEVPDRHLTASCFLAHPGGDMVLVHWHAKLQRWLQPGGHLDPGETPLEACLRELREEAGLVAAEPSFLFDLDVHRVGPTRVIGPHDHVDARFLLRAASADVPISPEGAEFRWMTWEELAESDPADTGLRRVAAKVTARSRRGS